MYLLDQAPLCLLSPSASSASSQARRTYLFSLIPTAVVGRGSAPPLSFDFFFFFFLVCLVRCFVLVFSGTFLSQRFYSTALIQVLPSRLVAGKGDSLKAKQASSQAKRAMWLPMHAWIFYLEKFGRFGSGSSKKWVTPKANEFLHPSFQFPCKACFPDNVCVPSVSRNPAFFFEIDKTN